jgi:tetratricopeptide (TPR) repeat protein
MMEPSIPVIQCDDCSKIFLKWKAEEVGQYSRFSRGIGFEHPDKEETPAEWKRAPRVKAPKEDDFYKAIDEGLPENKQEEKNLRLTAWWQSNDRCRNGFSFIEIKKDFPAPEEREKNMEKLLELLDRTNPNDQIMAAEILRQLGRFDEALEVLKKLDRDDYGEVLVQLEDFCDGNQTSVQKLTFSR